MTSVAELLFRSPTPTPLVTYYDDATGERTELSGVSLANWVAKTANLLVDGCGLGYGERAMVAVPPHWLTAVVLLGCWSAGLTLADPDSLAGPVDVAFVDVDAIRAGTVPAPASSAPDRYAVAVHPFGLPLPVVPDGYADYIVEVRGQGDHFAGPPGGVPAGQAVLVAAARARAAGYGLGAGARVLVDTDRYPDPLDWLLAPLAAGASIVACRRLDPGRLDARQRAERVTVTLA